MAVLYIRIGAPALFCYTFVDVTFSLVLDVWGIYKVLLQFPFFTSKAQVEIYYEKHYSYI